MTYKQWGLIAAAVVIVIVLLAAAFATPAGINLFFANVLLIIGGLTSLIEPSKGLIESAGVAILAVLAVMSGVTMRRQAVAKQERDAQSAVLADQNATLSHITQQVQAVKVAVVPPQDALP